jgi:hypothetical protein
MGIAPDFEDLPGSGPIKKPDRQLRDPLGLELFRMVTAAMSVPSGRFSARS